MKSTITKNMSYIGAGIGLTLFALFGLLYGSLIGGVIGLNVSGAIFGSPVEAGILQRMVVAVGMLTGILLAAVVCVAGSAAVGYLIGMVIDPETWKKKKAVENRS
jgi:quinol-cytochrome oxidoreductase complex cytochrome b subunit